MKDRTLLYYLDKNVTLTPTDQQISDVYLEEWWIWLKPHFSNLIWQYYSDRVVFVDRRFKLDASDTEIINNIIRAFSINLNTRNYEYKTLYNTTQLEYNPIWNVDGVTGTIHETNITEDISKDHTGSDTLTNRGYDTTEKKGSETNAKTGTDDLDKTGTVTTDTDNLEHTHQYDTTYDSVANPVDFETAFLKERTDYGTDNTEEVTYNTNDQTTYNSSDTLSFTNREDKTTYMSDHETEYDSNETTGRNESRQDLDLNIRQGNIGVTMTQDMIKKEREVAIFDFFKKVVHDCVNTCTYAID